MSSQGRDKSANATDGANALLGDLESIRTLLSEEEQTAEGKKDDAGADGPGSGETSTAEPAMMEPAGAEPDTAASTLPADSAPSAADEPPAQDDEVPLLDDVVGGALGVNELATPRSYDIPAEDARSGLEDDLFTVLLGEDWREAAAGILDQARAAIENHKLKWLPEDTDALNDALRVRIDETVHRWLQDAVLAGMEDLRARLLEAITDQLDISVRQHLQSPKTDEDAHGE